MTLCPTERYSSHPGQVIAPSATGQSHMVIPTNSTPFRRFRRDSPYCTESAWPLAGDVSVLEEEELGTNFGTIDARSGISATLHSTARSQIASFIGDGYKPRGVDFANLLGVLVRCGVPTLIACFALVSRHSPPQCQPPRRSDCPGLPTGAANRLPKQSIGRSQRSTRSTQPKIPGEPSRSSVPKSRLRVQPAAIVLKRNNNGASRRTSVVVKGSADDTDIFLLFLGGVYFSLSHLCLDYLQQIGLSGDFGVGGFCVNHEGAEVIGAHAVFRRIDPYLFTLFHSRLCDLALELPVDVVLRCLSATHPYPAHGLVAVTRLGAVLVFMFHNIAACSMPSAARSVGEARLSGLQNADAWLL